MYLLFHLYIFRKLSAQHQESQIVLIEPVLTGLPGSHLRSVKYTRCCINTIWLSWWWAL